MEDKPTRNDHSPIYNIKAVSRLVGLLPVTLRAWERRYGLPQPTRGDQGYRLYSEYDVRTLRWLKSQVEAGLSIGRAVEYLSELRATGYDPATEPGFQPPHTRPTDKAHALPTSVDLSIPSLQEQLLNSLLAFDEGRAFEVMRRAFTLYSVDQVLTGIVEPTLIIIGEAWHRGDLPIASEHYASQFFMQHLMSMMAAAAPPSRPGIIVAGCAPGEQHQIGLLMLVVMLRWRGWAVKYLGTDLSVDRLAEALNPINPQIIMFSANRPDTAARLVELPAVLCEFPQPKPLIVLGGQAFAQMRLPDSLPAIYVHGTPVQIVEQIEELMAQLQTGT